MDPLQSKLPASLVGGCIGYLLNSREVCVSNHSDPRFGSLSKMPGRVGDLGRKSEFCKGRQKSSMV